ncbi:MAG TPA: HD domain-containing phosphohydrolase [Acidimicrobiales bacterium]|nr:HD domain-containing phosphohydrolase [Acidimicrobiales bacterium]
MDGVEDRPVRLAELLAALSLGIDVGFGQPMEHVLRLCRIALRLAEQVDVDAETRAAVYYAGLLVNVACHGDGHELTRWFGDDVAVLSTKYDHEPSSIREVVSMLRMLGAGAPPAHRIRLAFEFATSGRKELDGMIACHAQNARTLADWLGLSQLVLDAVGASYERWDGKGWPGKLAAEQIPIAGRLVLLAEYVEVAHRTGGVDAAVGLAERRAGSQFDPRLVSVLGANREKVFNGLDDLSSWDAVVDGEPALDVALTPEQCDAALAAIGAFADLKSPYRLGHSAAVADLAATAAERSGLSPADVRLIRRAALVTGFGRLGVSNAVWSKAGSLTPGDWERVRLHPHLTERMLQSSSLAAAGKLAAMHTERVDGSGYPRGLEGAGLPMTARVLAAADTYQAMREPRSHRAAFDDGAAAAELRREAKAGRYDLSAVESVLGAAGHRVRRRREGPGGLTVREVEILRLIARGATTRQVADDLFISPKTVARHIEHIYAKIGATNRATAGLFAMRHGLLPDETADVELVDGGS